MLHGATWCYICCYIWCYKWTGLFNKLGATNLTFEIGGKGGLSAEKKGQKCVFRGIGGGLIPQFFAFIPYYIFAREAESVLVRGYEGAVGGRKRRARRHVEGARGTFGGSCGSRRGNRRAPTRSGCHQGDIRPPLMAWRCFSRHGQDRCGHLAHCPPCDVRALLCAL